MNRNADVVRDGYRVIAETFHRGREAKEQINVEWIDGLAHLLPSSGRVIDLGCGSGVPISRHFSNRGYDVHGYDLSKEMLEIAIREVPNATFQLHAIEELELEPACCDLVVSFFAFIHIDRELHAELFRRMFDWLRRGGAAFLSLGADDNPEGTEESWHGARMVWSHFDADTNLRLMEEAGFQIAWHEIEDLGDERHLFLIATKQTA